MLTFHTELFQTLVTQFKLSIEAGRNLPLGKWRWDINSICHFLPALHLTLFSFPFLSQPGLTNVQSKWCSADEPDHTAVLCYKAEWEISAICCQIPHAMQLAAFKAPPQLFLPNPSKVTAATTSHVLSGLLFHLPKPLSTLDKCFKEYFKREKKEHYLHYPEEKLSCLKKKMAPPHSKSAGCSDTASCSSLIMEGNHISKSPWYQTLNTTAVRVQICSGLERLLYR